MPPSRRNLLAAMAAGVPTGAAMAADLLADLSRAADANSSPLSGAKWHFYAAGTTTPQPVYTSAALDVEHASPVVADSEGQFPAIYFDTSQQYRGVQKTAAGATIRDVDPINNGVISQLSGPAGSSTIGFRQSGKGAIARTIQDKARERVSIKDFGAVGDNTTDDTDAIQKAIDYAHSLYVGGRQLGGGIEVHIPEGRYKFSGLIMKNGVNLVGDGFVNSQLRVFGNGKTAIAASTNSATQTSASNIFYCQMRNFALYSWEGANGRTPINQVGFELTGFRWTRVQNVYFGWGSGFTGIKCTEATLAGEGGPSQWYNEFYACNLHRHYPPATGGIGMLLGDTSIDKEQVTTLRWYGGDVRGEGGGTGVNLQGASAAIFDGTTFEGLKTAIILGSASGTRQSHSCDFRSCYFEGNTVNWHVHAGCTDNSFSGGFITGGSFTDNGTRTRYNIPAMTQAHLSGSTSADFWRVRTVNGGMYRPQFIDETFPSIELVRHGSADKLIIARSTFGTDAAQLYADDLSTLIAAFGGTSAKLRANNLRLRNDDAFGIFSGSGSPEGVVTAKPGSLYLNTRGGAKTAAYLKETGTGNVGWVAK